MIYFGDKLRALRLERNLTQQQVADRLELGKSSISAYEKNIKYPSIDVLIRLCEYFNTSADYLIGLSNSMDLKMSVLTDEQVKLVTHLIAELEQGNRLKDNAP
jgi:transcriptional regulator with XRE-family HTH domain